MPPQIPITLGRATPADLPAIIHVNTVTGPTTPVDQYLRPGCEKYAKDFARVCRLDACENFYARDALVIVAEIPTIGSGEEDGAEGEPQKRRIVGQAVYQWTSKDGSRPGGVEIPRQTLWRSMNAQLYHTLFALNHKYLDRTLDRARNKQLMDEEKVPTISVGDFKLDDCQRYWTCLDLNVLPSWQGHGVGTELVDWGVARAREGALPKIHWQTFESGDGGESTVGGGDEVELDTVLELQANPGTAGFYSRFGFEGFSRWAMEGLEWGEMVWRPSNGGQTLDETGTYTETRGVEEGAGILP